jgi:hypothetical protein
MRAKLSYANVMSSIAVFIALGGAAFAAGVIPYAARAGFANNAGAVNNLKASRSPKPATLLALDHRGEFPASVIPPPGELERDARGRGYAAAYCQQGEIVTGGGGTTDSGVIASSGPKKGNLANLVGWAVSSSDSGGKVTAQVLCARTAR